LSAPVIAPPNRFDGTEKELLRAFIARVVQCCTVCPKGQYNPEEEPEEDKPLESNAPIVLNEEWAPKPVTGLGHFLHRLPAILPQGRVEFWAPEAEEEEKERPVEKGPPILRPLALDEPIGEGAPSWTIKQFNVPTKLFWLRSNTWPGLHIVSSSNADRLVMQYYGWGAKSTGAIDWPPLPEPKRKPKPKVEEEEEEEDKEKPEKPAGEEEEGGENADAPPPSKPAKTPPAKTPPADAQGDTESGSYDQSYDE
jgi:hypothetical protein